MENNNLGMLLGAFILIVVGVVLVDSIADSVAELDDTITLDDNESLTWVANNTPIVLANDDIVSGSQIVYNQSNQLTSGSDYTMSRSTITFLNTSDTVFATDLLNITYTHEGVNYLNDSTSRTLINLVVLFFVLAILGVGYLIAIKSFDNMNF